MALGFVIFKTHDSGRAESDLWRFIVDLGRDILATIANQREHLCSFLDPLITYILSGSPI